MKILKTVRTQLVCLECGNIVTIQRRFGREKSVGHIKHLYCYHCEERTAHFEIKDETLFLNTYDEENLEEVKIAKLILEKKKNDR